MKLSDLKAGSSRKQTILLPVTSPYPIEMTVICGARPGKTLVVTAGVHGCEYVGIEALRSLKEELDPAALSGRVILLPLVNPDGFYHGAKQIVPTDGKNLNRMFPGDASGSFSSQLANILEETLYPEADFLMDLHGGDVNEALTPLIFFPTAVPENIASSSRAAAAALSVPYRVASTSKNGLYSWAAQKGIPALLVERGCRGLWSPEEVAACKANVVQMMKHLGICEDVGACRTDFSSDALSSPDTQAPAVSSTAFDASQIELCHAVYEEASSDGFWYPAVSTPGQKLKKGALLGTLKDFHGNEISSFTAPFDGVVLYYTLSLGVKAGDPLIAYGEADM